LQASVAFRGIDRAHWWTPVFDRRLGNGQIANRFAAASFRRQTPVDISVGLYLTNLVAIDESRETFEVTGYLFAKWQDPRLQRSADAHGDTPRPLKLEEIWSPPIEGENSVSHKMNSYTMSADTNGWVTYVEHFDGVLSTSYDLRKFPFDTQVLQFELEPFFAQGSEFQLAEQALPASGISRGRYAQLAPGK
jgi:hypothetical protein